MTDSKARRWDTDTRHRGIADARANLPAIQQLAELAESADWVAEDPEAHVLQGLRGRVEGSALGIVAVAVDPDGALNITLASEGKHTARELRQAVWAIIGGAAELTSHVRESRRGEWIVFDVVTGTPPGEGPFASHGHTIRLEIAAAARA